MRDDTVGDPMKDVAGPALLIIMKLTGMAALLIADVIRSPCLGPAA